MLARLPLPQESTWPRYTKILSPFAAFAVFMFTSKPNRLSDATLCLFALCLIVFLLSVIADNTYVLTPERAVNTWLRQKTELVKARAGRYWFSDKARLVVLEPRMVLNIQKRVYGMNGDYFSSHFKIIISFKSLYGLGYRDVPVHLTHSPSQISVESARNFVDWHQELLECFDSVETKIFLSKSLDIPNLPFHIEV